MHVLFDRLIKLTLLIEKKLAGTGGGYINVSIW